MKIVRAFWPAVTFLSFASHLGADTLTMKNGDHLTGTITDADGKEVTLKTDYAGEIKAQWSAVRELTSDEPLYVVTPDKKTVNGNVTVENGNIVVHTSTAGDVRVPMTQVAIVRSVETEQMYEKSLHPRLIDNWKGGVIVGLALARGNSNTTNLNTGFTADRKTFNDEIKLGSTSVYTTNGPSSTGVPVGVTANAVLGNARYDRNITKRLFAFVSGDFAHDALQNLILQQIYSGGLGWHLVDNANTTLDLLAGINYTRESYSATAVVPAVGRNLPGLTLGEDFMHKLGSRNVLTERSVFYPDLSDISQYRFSLDAGMVTKMNAWFSWQTSISDRYVTNPPGTKSNDVILSTGLNITFSH